MGLVRVCFVFLALVALLRLVLRQYRDRNLLSNHQLPESFKERGLAEIVDRWRVPGGY